MSLDLNIYPKRFLQTSVLILIYLVIPQRSKAQSVQRGEMEDVLKIVSADVQKNFYDPKMKGLDWPALTDETRRRIESSNNMGQMILAICSLLAKLDDSHTYFVPPRLTQKADFGFSARAYGNEVLVYEVEKKGPAAKAGLEVGDRIISLNGIAVDRGSIRQILRLLQRVVPTPELEIAAISPDGISRNLHIKARMILTQEHQYIESVWRVADNQRARDVHTNFSYKDDGDSISYVAIPDFVDSPDATYAAIKRAEHSRAVVLDLRGNPGGWHETLLQFLGFFTEQPALLARRTSRTAAEDVTIKPRNSGFKGAIVVLIDSGTSSAAELAAHYLRSHNKAQIVGDVSSGMVNEGRFISEKIGAGFVLPFAVVVTEAKLVMQDGSEIEGRGVIPNTECILAADDLRKQKDPCLEQALGVARKTVAGTTPQPK